MQVFLRRRGLGTEIGSREKELDGHQRKRPSSIGKGPA